jgi:uncharacterized membrane protein YebE (DUF533 family)
MGSQALDHAARQMGYRDYATYQAYQAQQQALRSGPPVAAAAAQPAQPQAPPQNWLQTLINATPLGGAMARVRKALP